MWFWLFVIVLSALALIGVIFQNWFWTCSAIFSGLWAVGIAVEVLLICRDERARAAQNKIVSAHTPTEPPPVEEPTGVAQAETSA